MANIIKELEGALALFKECENFKGRRNIYSDPVKYYQWFRDALRLTFDIIIKLEKLGIMEISQLDGYLQLTNPRDNRGSAFYPKDPTGIYAKRWEALRPIERDIKAYAAKITQLANIIRAEEKTTEKLG